MVKEPVGKRFFMVSWFVTCKINVKVNSFLVRTLETVGGTGVFLASDLRFYF